MNKMTAKIILFIKFLRYVKNIGFLLKNQKAQIPMNYLLSTFIIFLKHNIFSHA